MNEPAEVVGHAAADANPHLKETSMGLVDYSVVPQSKSTQEASMHRVLIVGGGAGGLELATRLGDTLGKRGKASIVLLDKTRVHVWKPHLHEIASGTLDIDVDSVEYLAHARAHHYRFRNGAMCGLDREKRQVYVEPMADEDGRQLIPPRVLGYDTLILAVGSVGNDFSTPGVKEHAIAIDSADEAARFNRRLINACVRANAQNEPLHPGQLHCVIIGAGATGVELVAELHKRMRDIAAYGLDNIDFDKSIRLTIIEAGPVFSVRCRSNSRRRHKTCSTVLAWKCSRESRRPRSPTRAYALRAASLFPPRWSSGPPASRRPTSSRISADSKLIASTDWL